MNNPPAFPQSQPQHPAPEGMYLRDYFAAAVLNSLLETATPKDAQIDPKIIAQGAYAVADAMLAQREKKS